MGRHPQPHIDRVDDERFAAKCGFCCPIVERSVKAFLKCGDLQEGFARVRCPDCHQAWSLVSWSLANDN